MSFLPRIVALPFGSIHFLLLNQTKLVILLAVQDSQDGKEQVEDVEIQADSSGDLLFWVVVGHDHLSVHQDITREDQSGYHTVHQFHRLAPGEEGSHETEDYEDPESTEKVWLPCGEVVLGLASKQCEEDEDAEGNDEGLDNDARLVERSDNRNAVCLERREAREEKHVCWI